MGGNMLTRARYTDPLSNASLGLLDGLEDSDCSTANVSTGSYCLENQLKKADLQRRESVLLRRAVIP